MKRKPYLVFFFSVFFIFNLNSQSFRYVESVFSEIDSIVNVVYTNSPTINYPYSDESSTSNEDFMMDIYFPKNDNLTNRPAIIFAHGGGFAEGNRKVNDMMAFCDSFARKGYVTVTIDYRQGVEVIDNADLHYVRAAYRGLQDGRSAIRYLRANAAVYGIDPDKIYWVGNSAGSFIGLNSIYMDLDEKPSDAGAVSYTLPPVTTINAPDLGDLDIGNNLGYNGEPNAVMACWGGVGDTLIIEADNDQNVFLIHGTADGIVDFNFGSPFGLTNVSGTYGSNSIKKRLNHISIPAQNTYFVQGEDHEFYGVSNGNWTNGVGGNAYWDTIVYDASLFFWQQHKPTANFSTSNNDLTVAFTDISTDASDWFWDFGDGNTDTQQNPTHTYSTYGNYLVSLFISNNSESWDTISQIISVEEQTLTPLSGLYSIGWAAEDHYQTLFQAITDLETNGVDGPVIFELSADYNTSPEAYPIYINNFAGSSQTNTLTIRPAAGTQHNIQRDVAVAVLGIMADNVIIDGSNNGTNSRDLTFSTTNTSDSLAAIAIYHVNNVVIKNCKLKTNSNEQISTGIAVSGSANLLFENNKIFSARSGINVDTCENVTIYKNEIGSGNTSKYLDFGIQLRVSSNIVVDSNLIFKLIDDDIYSSNLAICGIACNQLEGNVNIINNTIDSLIHTGNSNVVYGIAINNCNTSSFKIANNHISNLASDSYSDKVPGAIAINSPLLTSIEIVYNSIYLSKNAQYGIGGTQDNVIAGGLIINAGSGITFKNNIISNQLGTREGSTFVTLGAAIAMTFATNPFTKIDNNVYFVSNDYSWNDIVFNANGAMSLDQWQAFTGDDLNSIAQEDVCFVSDDDLHLNPCSPAIARAEFLDVFSTDIQGLDRNSDYPSIGAYEYEIIQATDVFLWPPVKDYNFGYGGCTPGSGYKRAVFAKAGNVLPETALPLNNITYSPNTMFEQGDQIGSSGWFCIDTDNDEYFDMIDSLGNLEFTIMVCEYFGSPGNEIYIIDEANLNPNTGMVGNISGVSSNLKIYPNPASKIININIDENIQQLVIFDFSGKKILQLSNINIKQVDVSNFADGIYLIEATTNSGVFNQKLIIKK
ncbi:MAG: right-handed parallel beta-helix repeat-containing protein [Bacteroidales bacterium]|nr:right-handed parallel beta-helix repeat-containing protein [Bacteroidales bacterium]